MADSQNNKEAILSVFLKVFNQYLGYYGANPHLADLERTLHEENRYEQFKKAFLEIRGKEDPSGIKKSPKDRERKRVKE